ncbi:hypothetical protein PG994_010389 [Apiospora phragmitis]|uniref:Integral membrane protein n=1 Tax=Apiospora phragmitis TaxID=2905665 RepID=A0ABR1TPR9_9PEZI
MGNHTSVQRSARPDCPPSNYQVPAFPSLSWPPESCYYALYNIWDSWRFTLLWTFILYAIFHIAAAAAALAMQIGKRRTTWKYMWTVPVIYALIAGIEALFTGTVTGVVSVAPSSIRWPNSRICTDSLGSVGAVYLNGNFVLSTWVPFIWGWINVLVLVVSSFSIQGGL